MAHMMDVRRNEHGNTFDVNRNNSSILKCFLNWRSQSEESLKKQNVIFRKAYYSHILFCCFNLDSNWFSYLQEMGLPVKAGRHELEDCLTYDDLDCMLLVEDIFNIVIRLSKSDVYLQKMLDAMKKMETNLINATSADYLLKKVNNLQIVQQTWNEVFLQFEASKSKKMLVLFLMKLYQQHVNAFDASVDSWEEMKRITIQDACLGDGLQEKGKEQVKNGNLREALGFFNEAIFNCPLDANNYKERAKVHLMLKNHKLCSSDLIRVHVLEPEWEEGYVIHRDIFKNLDEVWTKYYLKLIDKWRDSVYSLYAIQSAGKDMPVEVAEENGFGHPDVKMKEVKSLLSKNDQLVRRAMDLYKQGKYMEVLQKFKPNILETTFYQTALLSLLHLKRLDEARQLAFTATDTFTDMRQFSGDENEAKNLKKMFNFIKSLPCMPFAECDICEKDLQSTSIYLYDDLCVLDDLFHQGCVVLLCENRCKIAFHFECLSGSNSFSWTRSYLENYVGGMCTAPECQSHTISAEAFFVDGTKPIKFPGSFNSNLGAGHLDSQNRINSSSDEAILPNDLLESSVEYTAFRCSPPAQASTLNCKEDTKYLPSYKEYEEKKPGKKKKRRSRNMCPVPNRVDDNRGFTETLQLEDHRKDVSVSSKSSEIEKENLLLYLLSVLHDHGPQSESGEVFQIEMKAMKEEHKKIIDENGGLAFFLCQSNNVLLKDPDILYLNPDTLTTVIPDSDHFPLQTYQTSAVTENLASNVDPRTSISFRPEERESLGRNNREEFEASNQNMPPRKPNDASGYTDEYSSNPTGGFSQQGFVDEGRKKRNLRPDKREVTNILDESFSDSSGSGISSRITSSSSSGSSSSGYNQISERGKESEDDDDDDDDDDFRFSGDDSSTSTESDLRACEMCVEFKRRLVTLEQSYKNTLLQYDSERRKVELAEVEISLLKSQVEIMRNEIQHLKGKNDDVSSEGMEASNRLCSGKKKSSHKKENLAPLETDNLCVICHEHLLRRGANANLQCGHTFHNCCIRKWLDEQATCPTCRKHTLLVEEFPPLLS